MTEERVKSPEQIARERISQAERNGTTELSLSELGLTILPPEIGWLTSLTKLWVQGNKLTALPPEIGRLTNLSKLYLHRNKLSSLPPQLGQLSSLTELYLELNQLTSLPPEIGRLTNLTNLWVHDNEVTALPPEIGCLTCLTALSLYNNELGALPPEIGRLTNLTKLHLYRNKLTALPPEIGRLTNLTRLHLYRNELTALPAEIGRLTSLTELHLNNNRLAELPTTLRNLAALRELHLNDNEALGLPPEVLEPMWNKTNGPPAKDPAVPSDILDYYFRGRGEAKRRLNEAKLLVVGEASVGKTSLVNYVVHNRPCDPNERKTERIVITDWSVDSRIESGGRPERIKLNVWDFGGQEIMHHTHAFFLTRRSLYLLVLDARHTELQTNLDYWLRVIQTYGGDSPVLIVINKSEPLNSLDLDETRLCREYSNIRGFLRTSCESGLGIDELRAHIATDVNTLEHLFDELPESYFLVKDVAAKRAEAESYLDADTYSGLCVEHGVTKEREQKVLLRFLHELGTVLNYDDPNAPYQMKDTHILDPEWVTRGVYAILNDEQLRDDEGRLEFQRLGEILAEKGKYPPDRQEVILGIMQKFELCLEYPDQPRRFLVPELLPKKEQYLEWPKENVLRFRYHYRVLPGGLLPQFIVRTHDAHTKPPWHWRSGVLLEIDGCQALVRGDLAGACVDIEIKGPSG